MCFAAHSSYLLFILASSQKNVKYSFYSFIFFFCCVQRINAKLSALLKLFIQNRIYRPIMRKLTKVRFEKSRVSKFLLICFQQIKVSITPFIENGLDQFRQYNDDILLH